MAETQSGSVHESPVRRSRTRPNGSQESHDDGICDLLSCSGLRVKGSDLNHREEICSSSNAVARSRSARQTLPSRHYESQPVLARERMTHIAIRRIRSYFNANDA